MKKQSVPLFIVGISLLATSLFKCLPPVIYNINSKDPLTWVFAGLTLIYFLTAYVNMFFAVRIILNKGNTEKNIKRGIVFCFIGIWLLFIYYCIFYVSIWHSLIVTFIFLISLFLVFFKKGHKLAMIIFSTVTLMFALFAFYNKFEEDYCWRISDIEAKNSKEQSGVWYYSHMKCHKEFSFSKAIQDIIFHHK